MHHTGIAVGLHQVFIKVFAIADQQCFCHTLFFFSWDPFSEDSKQCCLSADQCVGEKRESFCSKQPVFPLLQKYLVMNTLKSAVLPVVESAGVTAVVDGLQVFLYQQLRAVGNVRR